MGTLQAKLTVNHPGDEYEREADRVTERVMRMPAPGGKGGCRCGGDCPRCRSGRGEAEGLQMRSLRPGGPRAGSAPPIVHEALRSAGRPLDAGTRGFMEPRFGHDFSEVRVHADATAAESARAVNAAAYTVGRDVVFGAGRYAPGTDEGRRLLAHELTHVVQQRGSTAAPLGARGTEATGPQPGAAQRLPVSGGVGRDVLSRRELIGEEEYTACTDPPYFWPQTCNDRENARFTEPVEVRTESEWRQYMWSPHWARVPERTFLRAVYLSDAEYEAHALEHQRGFFDFTLIDHDVEASRRLDRRPDEGEKRAFAKALFLRGPQRQPHWRLEHELLARFIRDWQGPVVEDEARAERIFSREQAERVIPERGPGFFNRSAEPVGFSMIESATALMMRALTMYIEAYGRNPDERENANRLIQSAGNILRQGAETLDEISAAERQRLESAIDAFVDIYPLPGSSEAVGVVRTLFKTSVTPRIGGALANEDAASDRMREFQSGTIQFLESFDYEAYGHSEAAGQDLKERLQTTVRSLLQ